MTLFRRLLRGISGQAFSRIAMAANSICLVPILIHAWGVVGYGEWVSLTALASYVAYSNFGLATTSSNEIIMASGAGDIHRAQRTFQMSINLFVFLVLPIVALVTTAIAMLPLRMLLHLTFTSAHDAAALVAFAGALIFIQSLRGLTVSGLYAAGRYGLGYFVAGVMKLIELFVVFIVVSCGGTPAEVMGAIVIVAIVDLATTSVLVIRAATWARPNVRVLDWHWVGRQIRPTIGFAVSNFATQGILVQGPRVVLGMFLGGAAVAVYAVYATTMRLVDQLLLTMIMPLEVEMARSSGSGESDRLKALIVFGTQLSWAMFIVASIGLLLFGNVVFSLWTNSSVAFNTELMCLYLLMSASNLLGRISLHAIISTNRLFGFSFVTLIGACLGLGIGIALVGPFGIAGVVVGGIAGEAVNSAVALYGASRLTGDKVGQLLVDLLSLEKNAKWIWRRSGQVAKTVFAFVRSR